MNQGISKRLTVSGAAPEAEERERERPAALGFDRKLVRQRRVEPARLVRRSERSRPVSVCVCVCVLRSNNQIKE